MLWFECVWKANLWVNGIRLQSGSLSVPSIRLRNAGDFYQTYIMSADQQSDVNTEGLMSGNSWTFYKSTPVLVSFRPQHIWWRRRLHQDAVHGPEHEKGCERNLLSHDLCHRYKERRDCVQRCDGHHHQRKPKRLRSFLSSSRVKRGARWPDHISPRDFANTE